MLLLKLCSSIYMHLARQCWCRGRVPQAEIFDRRLRMNFSASVRFQPHWATNYMYKKAAMLGFIFANKKNVCTLQFCFNIFIKMPCFWHDAEGWGNQQNKVESDQINNQHRNVYWFHVDQIISSSCTSHYCYFTVLQLGTKCLPNQKQAIDWLPFTNYTFPLLNCCNYIQHLQLHATTTQSPSFRFLLVDGHYALYLTGARLYLNIPKLLQFEF